MTYKETTETPFPENELVKPAIEVCRALWTQNLQQLDNEVMVLDSDSVAIIAEIEGEDYVLTLTKLPIQRARPVVN